MDHFLQWKMNNDDEDYTNFIMPHIERNIMEPTPCHTSILTGMMYVNEVLDGHECRCKREFRMETFVFRAFVKLLRDKELLQDGQMLIEEQVAMFLYTLAKNASNRTVQERFQRSGDTVSRYFHSVIKAITRLSAEIIIPPRLHMPELIQSRTIFNPFFKVNLISIILKLIFF